MADTTARTDRCELRNAEFATSVLVGQVPQKRPDTKLRMQNSDSSAVTFSRAEARILFPCETARDEETGYGRDGPDCLLSLAALPSCG